MFLRALMLASVVIQDCGLSTDLAVFNSGSFSPNPPIPGKNSTLTFSYYLKEAVRNGTVTYSTNINLIPFVPSTDALTQCPLSVGQHTEAMSSIFPTGLSGRIDTHIQWKTGKRHILCIHGIFLL